MEPNNNDFERNENQNIYGDEKLYDSKKLLAPTIVAVLTMIIVTVGATWAYYNVTSTGTAGTTTVTSSTAPAGLVTLSGTKQSITFNLTAANMATPANDITYYASTAGNKTVATNIPIGTATLTGDTTSTYTCSYKIIAKATAYTLLDAYSGKADTNAGECALVLEGTVHDMTNATYLTNIKSATGLVKEGTFTIGGGTATKTFNAQFYVKNMKSKDQSFIAGKTATITLDVSISNCHL